MHSFGYRFTADGQIGSLTPLQVHVLTAIYVEQQLEEQQAYRSSAGSVGSAGRAAAPTGGRDYLRQAVRDRMSE